MTLVKVNKHRNAIEYYHRTNERTDAKLKEFTQILSYSSFERISFSQKFLLYCKDNSKATEKMFIPDLNIFDVKTQLQLILILSARTFENVAYLSCVRFYKHGFLYYFSFFWWHYSLQWRFCSWLERPTNVCLL